MDKTAEDLKARTKRFVIAVLDFIETIPRTIGGDALARQLVRAGVGVAVTIEAPAAAAHMPNSQHASGSFSRKPTSLSCGWKLQQSAAWATRRSAVGCSTKAVGYARSSLRMHDRSCTRQPQALTQSFLPSTLPTILTSCNSATSGAVQKARPAYPAREAFSGRTWREHTGGSGGNT